MGYIGGRMVYMMMPGAKSIQNFIYESFNMIYTVIKSIISGTAGIFGGLTGMAFTGISLSWIGSALDFVLGGAIEISKVAFSYYATTILMEWTITMIPLLAISTACLVACIAYLVSLCKYFYISPFITAWAMATKKTDKIIDFLLAGIAIFFKPILIVLFVYLALFMQILVQDFFVFVSMEQFAAIESDWNNFHTNFIVGAIGGLIQIFGMLAASYVSWKLIVGGPSWALSLIGLDGKHDDMIIGQLESQLAKRAFVA